MREINLGVCKTNLKLSRWETTRKIGVTDLSCLVHYHEELRVIGIKAETGAELSIPPTAHMNASSSCGRPLCFQHPLDRHVRHLEPMALTDHLDALAQAATGCAGFLHGGDRRLSDGIRNEQTILG